MKKLRGNQRLEILEHVHFILLNCFRNFKTCSRTCSKKVKIMSNSLTPKDVLLAIYPNIEDNLVDILTKFSKDLEPVVKRKNEKIVQSDKLTNLLESFPRSYNNYSLCVDRFVSFGKRRPNDAITFLLSLLPNQ